MRDARESDLGGYHRGIQSAQVYAISIGSTPWAPLQIVTIDLLRLYNQLVANFTLCGIDPEFNFLAFFEILFIPASKRAEISCIQEKPQNFLSL